MKKRLLALLLAALMILSILPASAFAEELVGDPEQPAPAEGSEEIVEELDPAVAAANALLASGDLKEFGAPGEEYADKAEDAAADADEDAQEAASAADAAEEAAEAAAAALQDAENANNKTEANAAAEAAQDASVTAQKAAAEAAAAAQAAAAEATQAELDYKLAQAAYEAAQAQAELQLGAGLIEAKAAAEMTEAAAAAAAAAYENMLAAQAAADQSLAEAQAAADAADAELQAKADALEAAVSETAADVAAKNAMALISGGALAAADAAHFAVELELGYYDLRIGLKEAEIEVLQARIDEAQAKIDEAQAVVDAAAEELAKCESDEDYQAALAVLNAAQEALDEANGKVEHYQSVIDQQENDENVQTAQGQMAAVANGSADADTKKELTEYVFENLDVCVEGAESTEITWVELPEDDERLIFTMGDKYYQVLTAGEEGSQYLQFQEVKLSDLAVASAADVPADDSWSSLQNDKSIDKKYGKLNVQLGTKYTGLTVTDGEDEFADGTYSVVLDRYVTSWSLIPLKVNFGYKLEVKDGDNYYDLKSDDNGYYFTKDGERHNVTLCKPGEEHFSDPRTAYGTTSQTLEEVWASAYTNLQEWEALAAEAEAAEGEAQENYDAAAIAAGVVAAREALAAAEAALEQVKKENDTSFEQARKAELLAQIDELELEKNGPIAEQLVVVVITGGGKEEIVAKLSDTVREELGAEKQAEFDEIMDKLMNANALDLLLHGLGWLNDANDILKEAGAEINVSDFQGFFDEGQILLDMVQNATDGEFTEEDITSVLTFLQSDALSPKTKEAVMQLIVNALAEYHAQCVEALQTAVEEGIERVSLATLEATDAKIAADQAQLDLKLKQAAKTLADTMVDQAAQSKAAADAAAAEAAAKLAAYQELLGKYGPSDENVKRAKAAADAAKAAAAQAKADYVRASAAAAQAKADYLKAVTIASKKPSTTVSLFSGLRTRLIRTANR